MNTIVLIEVRDIHDGYEERLEQEARIFPLQQQHGKPTEVDTQPCMTEQQKRLCFKRLQINMNATNTKIWITKQKHTQTKKKPKHKTQRKLKETKTLKI